MVDGHDQEQTLRWRICLLSDFHAYKVRYDNTHHRNLINQVTHAIYETYVATT